MRIGCGVAPIGYRSKKKLALSILYLKWWVEALLHLFLNV